MGMIEAHSMQAKEIKGLHAKGQGHLYGQRQGGGEQMGLGGVVLAVLACPRPDLLTQIL